MIYLFALAFNWPVFFEIVLPIIFVVLIIVLVSVFTIRNLKHSYKDVFKYQSKLDIELRKIVNHYSKQDDNKSYFEGIIVKNLTINQKKELLFKIDRLFQEDVNKSEYLENLYQNLQEIRRLRDSKALMFNHKILMLPFSLYAKILKIQAWEILIDEET